MKICQSCSMPLEKDPQGGGTNSDGTRSTKYCSYCYDKGAFRMECTDVRIFQRRCQKILRYSGTNIFMAWVLTRGFRHLDRWRKK